MVSGSIEKDNSITHIAVIGGKVCVTTEKKIEDDKYNQWINSERY